MITKRNMDRGLDSLDLFQNDFQKFEKEVEKLSDKDRKQIAWWWTRCADYLQVNGSNLSGFLK